VEELKKILDDPDAYMIQSGGEYEIIGELCALRSAIKYKNLKIAIYGLGARGEYLFRWLRKENICPEFILDKDETKAGVYRGCPVYSICNFPEDIKSSGGYLVLISPMQYEKEPSEILYDLFKLNLFHVVYPFSTRYGLAEYRYDWAYYFLHHKSSLIDIYEKLGDDLSKEIYTNYVKTILTNQVYRGKTGITRNKYFECYKPIKNEIFLNLGAESGDTVCQFIENRNEIFKKIYAIEGDELTYKNKLLPCLRIYPEQIRNKIEAINCWLNADTIINFINKDITLINADIEGVEKEILGAILDNIENARPVFAICAYHRPEDLVELPKLIWERLENYVVFFRKYPAPFSNHLGNGELVMYAVPKERKI